MAQVSQAWLERVQRAQQMAANRLGVDVSIMKPPRQPGGGGAEAPTEPAAAPAAAPAAEPVAEAVVEAAPAAEAVETVTAEAPATQEAAPAAAAADRIAQAKARAAAKASNGGAAAPAAAPPRPAAPRPAPKPAAKPAAQEEVGQPGMNRREFLTYAWGAALGLVALQGGVATYFFMYPRFRAGEFGGEFVLGPATALPPLEAAPVGKTDGKFWLVSTEQGPKALYMVCTHLGCLYKWAPANNRFECPCHGSKFTREGYYIEGPAPRSLDQFVVKVVQNGEVVATTENTDEDIVPPQVPSPDAEIVVDTGKRIQGKPSGESPARAAA